MLRSCRLFTAIFCALLASPLAYSAELEKIDEAAFEKHVQPFFKQHCLRCHNIDKITSGVRVDHLDPAFEDRQLRLWKNIRAQLASENMPPEEEPQPADPERQQVVEWIDHGLAVARTRPTPKNGSTRRLTVAQYRNTLRELLQLEDDFSEILPPDAVSKDGFVNNNETLALSPLLLEAYFEIAEKALDACIVDENARPSIQNFRVDLGRKINPQPCPDNLILGANSQLLDNADFMVTQLTAKKPFPFEPFFMQTKYRFIEGYQGNDTVRGWREYDSIYHAVFACMRGNPGYPKGLDFSTTPEGLLLRPAIPSDEIFGTDNTYGPRANFKISLRELPDQGRFRVTVTAAKYDDGLLLDPGTPPRSADAAGAVVVREPETGKKAVLPQAGVYQVDVHGISQREPIAPDAARLAEGLIGAWPLDGHTNSAPERKEFVGRLAGDAKFVDSPFGKAISLDGNGDAVVVPRHESMGVGEGEFTVATWIHPQQLRQAGIVCLGKYAWTHGWYLDMPNNQGVLRIETVGSDNQSNGTVQSPPGTLRVNAWQHVAAVVRRGQSGTQLYVNGYPVAKGTIGPGNLDNPRVELNIGRIQDAHQFQGDIDDVRIYRRALEPAEIQGLVEPGRKFATAPPEKPRSLRLLLGSRDFSGTQQQPAFVVARFPAGELPIQLQQLGSPLDRVVFTPLTEDDPLAKQFLAFEQRAPRMGVHLGLRRDCGSTLAQVGPAQVVSNLEPAQFVFEGAIRNFPSPDVEKDNVNYLAGVREIGVRSEYTDGRDMPRLVIRSVEFEGPYYDVWPPTAHRNIFIDRRDDMPVYGRAILRNFATRAFRRPISADEEARLVAVFEKSLQGGASFQQSVKDALQVVLTSPQFLFLIEHSHTPEAEPIDDFELASKLSYFLWNGPPDDALLARASHGELYQSLDAEVARMIDDPRFARFSREFA
ncbi:MAG TPA: LamG-like jellyroll fold domain-containing protein, partial [Planctomycetaceae bacterium]|nr:LamG-like jellyroll fold domain-containing protein [Planctomycetaceae bacterium]